MIDRIDPVPLDGFLQPPRIAHIQLLERPFLSGGAGLGIAGPDIAGDDGIDAVQVPQRRDQFRADLTRRAGNQNTSHRALPFSFRF